MIVAIVEDLPHPAEGILQPNRPSNLARPQFRPVQGLRQETVESFCPQQLGFRNIKIVQKEQAEIAVRRTDANQIVIVMEGGYMCAGDPLPVCLQGQSVVRRDRI